MDPRQCPAGFRKFRSVNNEKEESMDMKTEYRRDLQHTWMILSGGSVPEEDTYSVRMLTENRIGGLVPCKAVSLDGELRFYYDISSRHALRTVLEAEQIGRPLLEQLLISLAKVMERMSEYLLDPDGLLLDPAYLFCNPEQSEITFCWYPGKDVQFREQAKILGSALLAQLDQSDRAGVVMGYRFYQYCESGELTPGMIRGLLRPKQAEKEARPATKEEIERAAVLDSFFDEPEEDDSVFGSFGHRIKTWFSGKRKKKETSEDIYDTVQDFDRSGKERDDKILSLGEAGSSYGESPKWEFPERKYTGTVTYKKSGGSETMMLTPDMLAGSGKKIWCLRVKEGSGTEREIPLTEDIYFVGKKGSGASLQLASSAVSRLHAKLEKNGENWCLSDLNSKNGTKRIRAAGDRRETLLQPEETVILQEGDEIWFADVMCVLLTYSPS